MRRKFLKKCIILGMVACILTGCGNAIPELTEEEASLVATYAADVVFRFSTEKESRLIDTEKERARREELEAKAAEIAAQMKVEEEQEQEEASSGQTGSGQTGSGSTGNGATGMQGTESMADFIGLDGFEVSYGGYDIQKTYPLVGSDEWEPTIEATSGSSLLIVKFRVTNNNSIPAVADVLSKNMLFHIDGEAGTGEIIGGTALTTMLLDDFAFAQDEIGAGESKEYVLMIQIDETITDIKSLSVYMKKGEESMTVNLM